MRLRATGLLVAAFCAATLFSPSELFAQLGGELRMQMGLGGDPIASVTYTDGSTSNLKLGTYFAISAGPIFPVWSSGGSAMELQGMLGWAGWSTGPENTDDRLSLNRFPLDAMLLYTYKLPARDMAIRLGGGVSHHMIGEMSGSGSLEGTEIAVSNATGPIAEVSAVFGILSAGLRYTQMENAVAGIPQALGGSSVGLFMSLTHPR